MPILVLFLYDKNMDEQRYPASITKILTALLIIENKQMTDTVTFGEHAVSESIPGNARINVQLGETITVEDALHAILLASANEVCTQLAIDIAGSEEGFAAMMNERAAALGCTNTHFVNANGLPDPNHYTSAHDMAPIMQECIKKRDLLPHRVRSDLHNSADQYDPRHRVIFRTTTHCCSRTVSGDTRVLSPERLVIPMRQ